MEHRCVWEHNGNDTLLYSSTLIGAYTRGASLEEAKQKMAREAGSYLRWRNIRLADGLILSVTQEKESALAIRDADSDVLFDGERKPLTREEYLCQKELALRSARDFLTLYEAVPDKGRSVLPVRESFYGPVPRTAEEMYRHTKNVNAYYFGEIGVEADNEGDILACRSRGFEGLESLPGFLKNETRVGSYGEEWSLRKVLRRFLWHDRIHAKALYRMAIKTFGADSVPNVFQFDL